MIKRLVASNVLLIISVKIAIYTSFYKKVRSGPSTQSFLAFSDFESQSFLTVC